jgi:hypothetical protein
MLTLVLPILLLAGADNATAAAAVPKPEKICREVKMETGSHIRAGKRCKTAEEWAREDAKNANLPVSAAIRHDPDDVARELQRPH